VSPPNVPGIPGTKLPPLPPTVEELDAREKSVREKVVRKRESLHGVRKNSPPDGTPASSREEGELLLEIAEHEEELRQLSRARQKRLQTLTQLRPPPEETEVVQAPAPAVKPPANLAWLTYLVGPIVTGVVTVLSTNYIKKEDFDSALKAQVEATATLTKQLDDERAARTKLERCFKQHLDHDHEFGLVTLAGFLKLGIRVWGQAEEVDKVGWKSEAMGDPNTGELPTWSPQTANKNMIQVVKFACVSE
jgi:hypothetical protein